MATMTDLITPQRLEREMQARLPAEIPASLGRIGPLRVRLARDEAEVRASQRLRHRVFFEASGTKDSRTELLDADRFDAYCEHLLVIDDSLGGPVSQRIVGTYRLLREERARAARGYYSDNVYDVRSLISRHPDRRYLELGRSCVLPDYRSKRTVELLWQGIWAYCQMHSINVMFGCASFAGIVPAAHALALSFLHHHARAKDDWRVAAISATSASMDLIPVEAVDLRTALAAMPPLVKGYLRLGAKFGDGAIVDQEFGSTDVFVIVRSEDITARYLNHFGPDAGRFV
jgi:L-ornithine Nalpha-acyltransferase